MTATETTPAVTDAAPEVGGEPDELWWADGARGPVLITGTDTGVGKTVVTAAVAAAAAAAGRRVAVVKLAESGAGPGAGDADEVRRLAGPVPARTLASFPDPLAPLIAARVARATPLAFEAAIEAVRGACAQHDLVLLEGAGGLLVPMGLRRDGAAGGEDTPWTVAELAGPLQARALVVARPDLGTLNHTALTLEALQRRDVSARVVIGAWPAYPGPVHWSNLAELRPVLAGAVPEGAGAMDGGVFQRSAPGWLTPPLYGVLDDWRVWAEEVR